MNREYPKGLYRRRSLSRGELLIGVFSEPPWVSAMNLLEALTLVDQGDVVLVPVVFIKTNVIPQSWQAMRHTSWCRPRMRMGMVMAWGMVKSSSAGGTRSSVTATAMGSVISMICCPGRVMGATPTRSAGLR